MSRPARGSLSGTTGHYVFHALHRMAIQIPPEPRAQRVEPKAKGIALPLTDEQILEARRLHEHERKSAEDVSNHFGVDIRFIRRVLEYKVRQKLFLPLRKK